MDRLRVVGKSCLADPVTAYGMAVSVPRVVRATEKARRWAGALSFGKRSWQSSRFIVVCYSDFRVSVRVVVQMWRTRNSESQGG